MRVHHLNCGSLRPIEPVAPDDAALPAVCHCLMVETDAGDLVLIEAGLGTQDIRDPVGRLGADWVDIVQPALVHEAEHRAATSAFGASLARYRPAQWAHQPRWCLHTDTTGEDWFGFRAVRDIAGLAPTIVLVPMAGHTRGHTAVAVDVGDRWLLHAGDAFYYRGELDRPARPHPIMEILSEVNETDRAQRLDNLERLRELHADPRAAVDIFAAHDPWALQAMQTKMTLTVASQRGTEKSPRVP